MGTVCSIVRNGIEYILRYFLPRYTSYFPRGYNNMIEDYTSRRNVDTREIDKLLTNGKDQTCRVNTDQGQNGEVSHRENFGNIAFLRGMMSNFFENYNFQLQVLNGRTREQNRSIKYKNDEETNRENRANGGRQYLNGSGAPNGWFEQHRLNIRREDSGFEDIKVNDTDGKPKIEVKSRFHLFKIRDDANIRTREHIHNIENCGHSDKIVKISIKSDENYTNDQRRMWDLVPTDEVLRKGENLSRSSSPINQKYINEQNADSNLDDETKHDVQKISLFHMHSGSHYSVNEGNQTVQLSNYSSESVPLRIPELTHKEIFHKELFSGGMVASEEFSAHLAIPNYYAENPIAYGEPAASVEFSRSSPEKLPPHHQLLPLRPTSCSGGGIVPQDTQIVTLPDFFPERDPLLRPVTIQISTQSSASSGGLVTSENDTIFSDLITQSLRFDALMESQMSRSENPDQEVVRRASDSEILTSPSKARNQRSKLGSV